MPDLFSLFCYRQDNDPYDRDDRQGSLGVYETFDDVLSLAVRLAHLFREAGGDGERKYEKDLKYWVAINGRPAIEDGKPGPLFFGPSGKSWEYPDDRLEDETCRLVPYLLEAILLARAELELDREFALARDQFHDRKIAADQTVKEFTRSFEKLARKGENA